MSSPESTSSNDSRGLHRKPEADIYTVLLAIALVAILVGLTFLALEMDMYLWEFKGGPTASLDRSIHVALAPSDTRFAVELSTVGLPRTIL